jgi:5,10-methylenetetrahydromethanopterin reductase
MERTGFRLQGSSLPLPQLVDAARLVESHGYEVMFVTRSSFMEMAVLGYETQRVLVGPGVATIFTSSVTELADQTATLHRVSNGRAMLGLGTGHPDAAESAGLPFHKPLSRMRDYVGAIKDRLSKRSAAPEATPPIYIAALRTGMCRLAGQVGDGVLLNWASPAYLEEAVGSVRLGAEEAGRDPESVDIACYLRVVPGEPDGATQEALARDFASYAARPIYRAAFDAQGYAEVADKIAGIYESDPRKAASLVPDSLLEQLTAVGKEATQGRLAEYRRMGVTLPVLAPLGSPKPDYWRQAIELAG